MRRAYTVALLLVLAAPAWGGRARPSPESPQLFSDALPAACPAAGHLYSSEGSNLEFDWVRALPLPAGQCLMVHPGQFYVTCCDRPARLDRCIPVASQEIKGTRHCPTVVDEAGRVRRVDHTYEVD